MASSPSSRLLPVLPRWFLGEGLVLMALAVLGACGPSYEPKEGLEGESAEDIARNMLAGAQPNQVEIAVAAAEDGWCVRHGRDPDVYENELYVPSDRGVVLSITGGSEDLSLNIPAFGVRKHIGAGKRASVSLRAVPAGEYSMEWMPVRGASGRTAQGKVHVVSQEQWDEMFK